MAKEKSANINISLEELLEAGCHFGHAVSKIHPQMREYVYMARQGVHIFDLVKTRQCLIAAAQFLADLVKGGGKVIFVGTKRQAAPIIEKKVKGTGMFYIKKRWIGGEDTEMFMRMHSSGFRVMYEPEMRVRHHIHPARLRLENLIKRAIAQGRGTVILKRGMQGKAPDHSGKSYILDTMFNFVPRKMKGLLSRKAMNNIRDLGLVFTINLLIVLGYVLEMVRPLDER